VTDHFQPDGGIADAYLVPSPDNRGQLNLDGLLALAPQAEPATPGFGVVLYVDSADGALKFKGSVGTVTTLATA
jgi:hypothetical protein